VLDATHQRDRSAVESALVALVERGRRGGLSAATICQRAGLEPGATRTVLALASPGPKGIRSDPSMKALDVVDPICCAPDLDALPEEIAVDLASRFKALADPTRVAIVNRLARSEECCVCNLVDEFELSQPTISHHLRILREAGLVEAERRGTWAYYRLLPEAIGGLRSALGA
jgi:ArsR family transcriptional regulator